MGKKDHSKFDSREATCFAAHAVEQTADAPSARVGGRAVKFGIMCSCEPRASRAAVGAR